MRVRLITHLFYLSFPYVIILLFIDMFVKLANAKDFILKYHYVVNTDCTM